jgi:hypothetical protein
MPASYRVGVAAPVPTRWHPRGAPRCPRAGYLGHLLDPVGRHVEQALANQALPTVEGVSTLLADPAPWSEDAELRGRLTRAIARVESEPALLGASPHLPAVGRA